MADRDTRWRSWLSIKRGWLTYSLPDFFKQTSLAIQSTCILQKPRSSWILCSSDWQNYRWSSVFDYESFSSSWRSRLYNLGCKSDWCSAYYSSDHSWRNLCEIVYFLMILTLLPLASSYRKVIRRFLTWHARRTKIQGTKEAVEQLRWLITCLLPNWICP